MKQPLFKAQTFGLLFAFLFTVVGLATLSATASAEGNHKGGHGDSHGDDHGKGAHWMSPAGEAEKPNSIKADAASIERGKKHYATLCAACHGAAAMGDGVAGASLDPKPTNLKAMSGGHPDGDFAWKIANGRGAMPAWKSVLKENQIWDLVNFIQDLKNDSSNGNNNENEHGHDKKPDKHNHEKHTH
ncbi:MAG: cytochrome c [Cocleimonas sp.]|nr:cytochrome c [Cocleimonas sp.]